MEIKETLTINDLISIQMDIFEKSDVTKYHIKKKKLVFFILLLISISSFVVSLIKELPLFGFFSFIFTLSFIFEIIFAKRRYFAYIQKNIKKNIEMTAKQYGFSLNRFESNTLITNDKVISESRGTSTTYLKSDFMNVSENDKSYILQFTNGRFIYFKKSTFNTNDEYLALINVIKSTQE